MVDSSMFVTSSTNPGFGGWFDDPIIRMIQVERLKPQPCPMLFSECFAPSVSHLGDENNDLCQLLASDPSLCSIFNAESLLRFAMQSPTADQGQGGNRKALLYDTQRYTFNVELIDFKSLKCNRYQYIASPLSIDRAHVHNGSSFHSYFSVMDKSRKPPVSKIC